MQVLESTDSKSYDDFLIEQKGSLLQSWVWGEFQKKLGRKVWRLLLTTDLGKVKGAAQIIKMSLPRGKSYFYSPYGPTFSAGTDWDKLWRLFLDKVGDIAVQEKPVFLRVDPALAKLPANVKLDEIGFQKIPWEVQPRDSLILGLSPSTDDILHQMKPKTRYNIRLAEKKGVTVSFSTDSKDLKSFWLLMRETSTRDRFSSHPYAYYQHQLQTLSRSSSAELVVASYKLRPVAIGIIAYFGHQAWYLHGASSNNFRAVMAPYLMQWEAIKRAKTRGCVSYDFGGIAPASDSRHSWQGITRFKKGFGGDIVTLVGAYDFVYDSVWYKLYRLARKLKHFT